MPRTRSLIPYQYKGEFSSTTLPYAENGWIYKYTGTTLITTPLIVEENDTIIYINGTWYNNMDKNPYKRSITIDTNTAISDSNYDTYILYYAASSNIILLLPNATIYPNREIIIINDNPTYSFMVELSNGAPFHTLYNKNDSIVCKSDGAEWYIISQSNTISNTILDQDDMSSNSPFAVATQQSIKAYVDNVHAVPSVYTFYTTSTTSPNMTQDTIAIILPDQTITGNFSISYNCKLILMDGAYITGNVTIYGNGSEIIMGENTAIGGEIIQDNNYNNISIIGSGISSLVNNITCNYFVSGTCNYTIKGISLTNLSSSINHISFELASTSKAYIKIEDCYSLVSHSSSPGHGIYIDKAGQDQIADVFINNCFINDHFYGIYVNNCRTKINGCFIDSADIDGIRLVNGSSHIISDNKIINCYRSLALDSITNSIISNNILLTASNSQIYYSASSNLTAYANISDSSLDFPSDTIYNGNSGGNHEALPFTLDGNAYVSNSGILFFVCPYDFTVVDVDIKVDTATTGSALIVDILKNGTTIFTTTSNRPEIASAGTSGTSGTPNVTSFSKGDILAVAIDQIGNTIAGGDNLYVTINILRTSFMG